MFGNEERTTVVCVCLIYEFLFFGLLHKIRLRISNLLNKQREMQKNHTLPVPGQGPLTPKAKTPKRANSRDA